MSDDAEIAGEMDAWEKMRCLEQAAYFKWQQAGCPSSGSERFWEEAERELVGQWGRKKEEIPVIAVKYRSPTAKATPSPAIQVNWHFHDIRELRPSDRLPLSFDDYEFDIFDRPMARVENERE